MKIPFKYTRKLYKRLVYKILNSYCGTARRRNKYGRPSGGGLVETVKGALKGLNYSRAYRFAALYAHGADVDRLGLSVQRHFLFLKVGLEKPFGRPVRVTIGITGNGFFAAKFAFVSHVFIIANPKPGMPNL